MTERTVITGAAACALGAGVSTALTPMGHPRAHRETAQGSATEPLPPCEGCGVLVADSDGSACRRGAGARTAAVLTRPAE